MPDVRGLMADPEFNALPMERRVAILGRINPQLAQEYGARQESPNFPGKSSELRQGKPQSAWSSAWDSVRQSIFGSPEREEAKAAGIGLQPTTADMADLALTGASFMGAPGAGRMVASGARRLAAKAPRPVAAVLRFAEAHPRAASAALTAAPSALHGNVEGALEGAALGALVGGRGPAPTPAEPVKRAAAAVVDRDRQAAASHGNLVSFAREAAKKNPKVGEKIWMLLDDAGSPLQVLTPDQAGAAARAGRKTTWVKNLWK